MKVNTRNKLLLIATVLIVLNFSACKKDEDTGTGTGTTQTQKIVAEWEVITQGVDTISSDNLSLILEFENDGDFAADIAYTYFYNGKEYSYGYTYDGEWEWESAKEESVVVMLNGDTMVWDITKLTSSDLWFEDEEGSVWECEKQ